MDNVFLDTSVILLDDFNFNKYNRCNISQITIEELDNLKEYKPLARIRLKEIFNAANVEIIDDYNTILPKLYDMNKNDNKILACCQDVQFRDKSTILMTADCCMALKAKQLNIEYEFIEQNKKYDNKNEIYSGIYYADLNKEKYNDVLEKFKQGYFTNNQYILFGKWNYNNEFDQEQFIAEESYKIKNNEWERTKKVHLPKRLKELFKDNYEQQLTYDAINDDNIDIIFLYGEAGTGKNFSTIINCLYNVLNKSNKPNQLLYTRNTIEVGQRQGYLPGDAFDKNAIYMSPCRETISKYFNTLGIEDKSYVDLINEKQYYELPFSYIRGRTFDNTYMIFDEASNATVYDLQTFITRAGKGSKVIITGSLNQIDNYKNSYCNNGLYKAMQAYKGQSNCAIIKLNNQKRSYLARQADKLLLNFKDNNINIKC